MSTAQPDYDYLCKYLLIGNSGVGKSCLLIRFTDDRWSEGYEQKIGVNFQNKILDIEGKLVKLQIWDAAGNLRLGSYYKGANGIMMVYDITNLESFKNLNSCLDEIKKYAPENVYKILVGNKNDLEKNRKVTFEQGKEFAIQNGMKFFETSAKEINNIQEIFLTLTKDIIQLNEKFNEKNNNNIIKNKKEE